MRFRPCIDLHDGAVKQIVGGTLRDGDASNVTTNFVASAPAAAFARRYAAAALPGGHVIMLGAASANTAEACAALAAYPGGLQVGGACGGAERPASRAPHARRFCSNCTYFTPALLGSRCAQAASRPPTRPRSCARARRT